MKRRDDMQVNVAGLRRWTKNIAHNYSNAQVKVREATSNDPWGPSSTLMAEIADLTYNVVAFTEIMQMVWRRLNDHGRNWRHVYKALVLLEYLIKTGNEKVAQQCRENIFAIQTLKDFQYLEEGKDQGLNVREKAKQLVSLLNDEERLRNERARALKAKERFAQSASGFGSDGQIDTPTSPKYPAFRGQWDSSPSSGSVPPGELENARPQTAGEEELQLQLALAMSREEAEQDAARRRSDQVRLQLALSQSQNDFQQPEEPKKSHMLDLLDVNLSDTASAASTDPWGLPMQPPPQPPRPQTDPWSVTSGGTTSPTPADPWAPVTSVTPVPQADPWQTSLSTSNLTTAIPQSTKKDPWAPTITPPNISPLSGTLSSNNISNSGVTSPILAGLGGTTTTANSGVSLLSPSSDLDEFDIISNRNTSTNGNSNNNKQTNGTSDPFDLGLLVDTLPINNTASSTGATKKTPQSFLGENSSLVNLDNLVTLGTKPPANTNTTVSPPFNPFADTIQPRPTMNQIKQQPFTMQPAIQDPWAPANTTTPQNQTPWMKPFDQPNPFFS